MALGAVLFALMNFFARLATASASWMTVGGVRALIGAAVAIGVARVRGSSLAAHDRKALFWRSLFGTAAMASTFYALSSRTLPLGDTVTLLNLTPIFLAVLAPIFLREPTSKAVAFALLLALGGVVLILHPSLTPGLAAAVASTGPSASTTVAIAVMSAFFTSIAMMMLRRAGRTETPEVIALHFSLFAAAVLLGLSLFDLRMPAARDLGFIFAAGICAGFAQLAMTRAYTLESAARVSGIGYLSVVASAILGAAVLGERPTAGALAGMALVVAGGLLVTFMRDATRPKEE